MVRLAYPVLHTNSEFVRMFVSDCAMINGSLYSLSPFIFSFSKWVPEISHHCPRTPFLLVGTQVDLRDDSNTVEKLAKNKQRPISPESGEKLARDLRAVKYVECSALTQVKRAAAHTYDDITAFIM